MLALARLCSGSGWMKASSMSHGAWRQEKCAHRVRGALSGHSHKGGAGKHRKGGGNDAPPGNKARDYGIKVTTIHAHGLTFKRGGAPAAGRGALLGWGSRMTRKDSLFAPEFPY